MTSTISFDTDAAGAPLSAPCVFAATAPLTELYASLGVHFTGPEGISPEEQRGGAILNECGNFDVPARSGTNFLAFNRDFGPFGLDPETVRFDVLQRTVAIFSGGNGGTFTMVAYRGSAEVATATTTPAAGAYGELSVTSEQGIDRVVLTATGEDFVFDDLSFVALPIPQSRDDCKNGGWRNFSGFKNQGDCISFVATAGRNSPGQN